MKTGAVRKTVLLCVCVLAACFFSACGKGAPPPAVRGTETAPARSATPAAPTFQPPAKAAKPAATITPTLAPTPFGGDQPGLLWIEDYEALSGYNSHIAYIQRPGSDDLTPVAPALDGYMWVQSVSPDGLKILAAASDVSILASKSDFSTPQSVNVFVISLADGLISNLSDAPFYNIYASWSPDSQAVVYTNMHGAITNIYRVNTDGSAPTQLTRDGISSMPVWSPSGEWIAFVKKHSSLRSNLYRMAPDGSGVRALTAETAEDGWMASLAWSPDGRHLAFARAEFGPNSQGFPASGGLYLADPLTGEVTQLDGELSRAPAWSPDGTRLAYVHGDSCVPCKNDLVVLELATREQTILAHYDDRSVDQVRWSADGRLLSYSLWQVAGLDSDYSLVMVDPRSGEEVKSWKEYRSVYWLPQPVPAEQAPANCPAGPSTLAAGEQAVLSPDRPTNPLRAIPGRNAYQLAEIQQGTLLKLITRACAPERIYWLVELPDGSRGWTAEGDGKTAWLTKYTGQPLAPAPQPTATSGAGGCVNDADFMGDVTVPDYTKVEAGKTFTKTWRIKNTGSCTWSGQYTWRLITGDAYGAEERIPIDKDVPPGGLLDVSAELTAPSNAGTYQNAWQLHDASGVAFGTKPFLIFVVP